MPHFLPSPALCRPPSTSHLNLFMAGDAWHSVTHSPVSEELFGATTDGQRLASTKQRTRGDLAHVPLVYALPHWPLALVIMNEVRYEESLLLSSSTKAESVNILPLFVGPRQHLARVPVLSVHWASLVHQTSSHPLFLGGCHPAKPCPTQGSPGPSPPQCHQGI